MHAFQFIIRLVLLLVFSILGLVLVAIIVHFLVSSPFCLVFLSSSYCEKNLSLWIRQCYTIKDLASGLFYYLITRTHLSPE